VKNASECAKNLTELLKTLPAGEPPAFAHENDPVAVLVLSFLMWESSTDKALAAYERLFESVTDCNDLRVCMPHETAGYLGARYPRATERSERLRAALRNIFLREHAVNLDARQGDTKRQIRKYLESLEGMVPYVAGRVMLLCFDTHTIPVDELLRRQLVAAGAVDEEATVSETASWLSRQIKARDGRNTHYAFQAWIDRVGGKPAGRSGRKKAPAGKTSAGKSRRKRSGAGTHTPTSAADSAT
jgi:endonuclease III